MRATCRPLHALLPVALLVGCSSSRVVVPDDGRVPAGADGYATAFALLVADDPVAAAAAIEPVASREPWWVPAHVLRQDALVASGGLDAARIWYGEQAAASPGDAARVLLAGRVARRGEGRPESDYRAALALDADSPWPALALAYELARAASLDVTAAVDLADRGFATEAAASRGAAKRRLDEALGVALHVTEDFPALSEAHATLAEVLLLRGRLLREAGSLRQAREAAGKAVRRDPGNPRRHVELARIERELIDDAAAEASLRAALALAPQDAGILAGLGRVLLDLGRAAEAEDVLRTAVAGRPDDAAACADLGVALHRLGETAQALEWLDRAVSLAPDDERIRASRALAGQPQDAP